MGQRDESGVVDESVSMDGSGEVAGPDRMVRWMELGELLRVRRPSVFALMLRAAEATASELTCSPEYIDDVDKM